VKKKFSKVLGLATAIFLFSQSAAIAEPITLVFDSSPNFTFGGVSTEQSDSANGDDDSYQLQGVSLNLDGNYYNEVFISVNSVLSFGNGDITYEEFPAAPSISFGSQDYTVDYNGASADEVLTAERNGNIITITIAGRLYPDNGAGDTAALNTVVITIDTSNGSSYSYTLNGVAGSDYSLNEPRTGARLANGEIISLSAINARSYVSRSNALRVTTRPVVGQSGNTLSCSPGSYVFLNGGSTEEAQNLGALVYTLVIDGKPVSRLGAGSYASLPSNLFPAFAQTVQGTADMKGATWDVSALKNFDARCEVYAWQSGGNIQSTSEQISDAVKAAEIAAKAQAWEDQRASATAANFTQQAREMRKRIAARSGN
jgi:hypothetical protein